MTGRTAVLHIGPMKTGSSSIQFWLQRNAAEFRQHGFLTALGVGGRNRSWLAHLAAEAASGDALSPGNAEWLAMLRQEFDALPPSIGTVILSGEMMGQTMLSADAVGSLKQILDPYFDRYRVVAYLRRQDQLATSRYSTALRQGNRRAKPLGQVVDLEAMLAAWGQVFGHEAMCVRLFDRSELAGGDVVRDFATAVGLPLLSLDDKPIDRNPSLRPEAQLLLAELAERVRQTGHRGAFGDLAGVETVNRMLGQHFRGRGMMPGRREAEAFYETYRDANERIRQAWFPERHRLFAEDFSDYPEGESAEPPPEARLEAALQALTALLLGSARAATGEPTREQRRAERRARRATARPSVVAAVDQHSDPRLLL